MPEAPGLRSGDASRDPAHAVGGLFEAHHRGINSRTPLNRQELELARTGLLRALYLTRFSIPGSDRAIYRAVCRGKARRILELGIGTGQRGLRMIELAAMFRPMAEVEYCGLDVFESRTAADGPGMSLKMAHRLLRQTGASIRLIPGDPHTGLAGQANSLGQLDLVVVSARLASESLAAAWFYVPRLLGEQTKVFRERLLPGGGVSVCLLSAEEIGELAAAGAARRAA
jgi:hypothetical protein